MKIRLDGWSVGRLDGKDLKAGSGKLKAEEKHISPRGEEM